MDTLVFQGMYNVTPWETANEPYNITGLSGSGKSAVLRELVKRGYEAHGVDEEGYADWIDRKTDEIIPFPQDESSVDIHDWYRKHK